MRNPIDRFILARLEQEKLYPSAEADRVTLLRRLSFDLTGLPPTPEEVERFLADNNSDAYEKLVDRLLASPRHGERWARHWLDVVHYGETHGYDKDKPRLNSWPYRDYVIRAFNADKPYWRFVQEQLAGDILFPDEPDGIVALGFVAAGPWDFVGHVELPESKTDGLIARYNDRDDMVMTTLSTFQSLTVHCARCHDHKFDPISQKEYYGLQAVFAGVDRAERLFDSDKPTLLRRRTLATERESIEGRLNSVSNRISQLTSPELQRVEVQLQDSSQELASFAQSDKAKKSPSNGYHSGIERNPDIEKWVQADLGGAVELEEIRLVPARPTDFPDTPGFGFPARFKVEISDEPQFANAVVLADHTREDFKNPGDAVVVIALKTRPSAPAARHVRVTATRLWERTHDYVFALAELQVYSGGTNAAMNAAVTALDSIEAGRWSRKYLVDGYNSRQPLDNATLSAAQLARRKELESTVAKLTEDRRRMIESLMDVSTRTELAQVTNRLHQVRREFAALPAQGKVYAVASDFTPNGSFTPPKGLRPVHVLGRGDVKRPGELATPTGLACVSGPEALFRSLETRGEGSRRAALAGWITDPKNLLTRQSIVNRVWQYHFGRGIVETPNDFGHMGALPTHPELLDWLSFWFVDNGESLKKLHRLILTSATYRQVSSIEGRGARVEGRSPALDLRPSTLDSDNRYLWRMNRARLDAEAVRDTMLFVSGKLDAAMGGPSVQQFYFKDDHSPVYDYTRFDADSPGSYRRSIYRFIVRSVPDPFMEALDCPDANLLAPRRNTTMTALQALAMLNDPFVIRQAGHFADRVSQERGDLTGRIEMVYRLALGRAPASNESKKLATFAQQHGLANACRLIFNSNEFLFVD